MSGTVTAVCFPKSGPPFIQEGCFGHTLCIPVDNGDGTFRKRLFSPPADASSPNGDGCILWGGTGPERADAHVVKVLVEE